MKDIIVNGNELQKIIEESIPNIFKEKFTSTYSNPLADIIEKEIKESEGVIRTFVKTTIADILTNKEFKDKMTTEIISLIIQKGLK